MSNLRCGFVGLGSQGAPIARRMISAGFPMTLWARRPETLIAFRGSGASISGSIKELAARVDYVGVCVTGDVGVSKVCESLIDNLSSGAYLVVHSTVLPATVKRLGNQAEARQLVLIDAPVSGGGQAADRGELTVMTGGDATSVNRIKSILKCFSSQQFHLGELGAA